MSTSPSSTSAWHELDQLEARGQAVACCGRILTRMLTARRPELAVDAELLMDLEHAELVTALGDVAAVLRRGADQPGERALASALSAAWLAEGAPKTRDAWERLAADALWLASRTTYDPFPCIEQAFMLESETFWSSLLRILTEGGHAAMSLSRGDRALGAALLQHRDPERSHSLQITLPSESMQSIPTVSAAAPFRLEGQWAPAPLTTLRTVVYAMTGWLLLRAIVHVVLVYVLRMTSPAQLEHSGGGVRIESHRELFGQRLLERTHIIAADGLAAASRETRYDAAGLYAGLFALLVGSYFGVSWVVDGVRASSTSLIGLAILAFALGVALDFALTRFLPKVGARTSIALEPKSGRTICLSGVAQHTADELLVRLRGRN
jgi:hypothetical protein